MSKRDSMLVIAVIVGPSLAMGLGILLGWLVTSW